MSVGYPDYARLAQQGGTLLYQASNASPPEFSYLFKGYVGSWPFVNLLTNLQSTAEIVRPTLAYFTDSTFATEIAAHTCTRLSLNFGYTQYVNLSPWLGFWYVTQSTNVAPFNQLGLYATTSPADARQMYPLDEGLLVGTESISASTTSTHLISTCCPGNSRFELQTASTSWFVNVSYYSYAQNAYVLYHQYTSGKWGAEVFDDLPLPDAPLKVDVHNSATSAFTFVYGFMAVP